MGVECVGQKLVFRLMIVSIHIGKVQIRKTFRLQRPSSVIQLKSGERLLLIYSNGDIIMAGVSQVDDR